MAIQIDAGEVTRKDYFMIDPANILVDHALNGRVKPHDEKSIHELAESIVEHGQKQPVSVRRVAGNKVQLVFGYRRYEAVSLFNKQNPDKALKLKAIVVDANDTEAFIGNVVENIDRKTTNAVDDAHNQRRLREEMGWAEDRIAKLYHCSVTWVGQVRKILTLPEELQAKIIDGNLSVGAALELTGMSPEELAAAVAESTDATGKIDSGLVKAAVRKSKQAKGGKHGMTLKEVRRDFDEMSLPGGDEDIRIFAKVMLGYLDGSKTVVQLENGLKKLAGK